MRVKVNSKVVKKAATKIQWLTFQACLDARVAIRTQPFSVSPSVSLSVTYTHTHTLSLSLTHTHTHTHTQLSLLLSFSLLCFLFQPAALFFRAHITPTHTEPSIRRASLTQLFYQSSPDKWSWDCPGTFACPWTCCCAQKNEIPLSCVWDSFSLLKPGALGVLWIGWSVTKEEEAACRTKARESLYM